jgi:phosphoglucosamine mutase
MMMRLTMGKMFGTSGIRGVYGKDVTTSLAMRVGNAVGGKGKKVVLSRDARGTSPVLSNCASAGAMLAGSDIVDLGIAPTPLLAYATRRNKCDGIMITASHNPPEYNGIKLFSNGMEYTRAQENEVEKKVGDKEKTVEWNEAGQKKDADYASEYISFLLSKVDAKAIKARKPRVLVDAGNAAAYAVAPALLIAAGCEVIPLNCDRPGQFVRNLEPKQSTLTDAAKLVVEKKCDFGVAFDGDGDRAIAIDEKGNVLALDVQLAIFCKHILTATPKEKRKIVTTVEASLSVREAVETLGGKISITPVGSLHVAIEVERQKACFGGEPCGEYVFPESIPCADGLMAALMIAQIFCKDGKLSALSSAVKTYPIERRKYACENAKKDGVMGALSKSLSFEGKLNAIDGLRYDFSDGWVLIRPSGTEPAIRLTSEAKTKEKLDSVVKKAEEAIEREIRKN